MSDGIPPKCNLGVPVVGEQAATGIADAIERGTRDIGGRDDQQGALRTGRTDINAATATGRVGDANLGDLGAKQREDGVRVVAGVFVDREDLEREPEGAQVLGGAPHGDAHCLLVIAEGQNDGDVEPRALEKHRLGPKQQPCRHKPLTHRTNPARSSRDCNMLDTHWSDRSANPVTHHRVGSFSGSGPVAGA